MCNISMSSKDYLHHTSGKKHQKMVQKQPKQQYHLELASEIDVDLPVRLDSWNGACM